MKVDETLKQWVAVIPARSGSKGIKDKNCQLIKNKSLIQWAVDSALRLGLSAEQIFVASDSKSYQDYFSRASFLLRNKNDAGDEDGLDKLIVNILPEILKRSPSSKNLLLLLPTQPFRNNRTMRAAIEEFRKVSAKALISVKQIDRSENTIFFRSRKSTQLVPLSGQWVRSEQRQSIDPLFTPCGCFYLYSIDDFRVNKSLMIEGMISVPTSFPENLDIDSPLDLEVARHICEKFQFA